MLSATIVPSEQNCFAISKKVFCASSGEAICTHFRAGSVKLGRLLHGWRWIGWRRRRCQGIRLADRVRLVHPSDAQNDHDEDRDKENAEDQRSKCHNADFLFTVAPGKRACRRSSGPARSFQSGIWTMSRGVQPEERYSLRLSTTFGGGARQAGISSTP